MDEQLQLIEQKRQPWQMTDWYRRVGRKGVRQAKLVLAQSDPKPHTHTWRITHTTTYGTLALRCRKCPAVATASVQITGEASKVSAALTESRGLVQVSAADLSCTRCHRTDVEVRDGICKECWILGPFGTDGVPEVFRVGAE